MFQIIKRIKKNIYCISNKNYQNKQKNKDFNQLFNLFLCEKEPSPLLNHQLVMINHIFLEAVFNSTISLSENLKEAQRARNSPLIGSI